MSIKKIIHKVMLRIEFNKNEIEDNLRYIENDIEYIEQLLKELDK